jgi:hypothetical protein
MKRSLVIAGLIMIAIVAYAAEYQSRLGSHDLRWGTGTWVDNGGRTRYFISGLDIPFSYDNNIKLGNTNLYNLSSGVVGNWKVVYTNGSGTVALIALDNAGLCFKSNGPAAIPSWGTCGSGSGSYYDPAAVAITGGSINGIFYITLSSGYISLAKNTPIGFGPGSGESWAIQRGSTDNSLNLYTRQFGSLTADNTAMFRIQVNDAGGTIEPAQRVFGVMEGTTNEGTYLFHIDGAGNVTTKGNFISAGSGSTAADGYRRMNICNTGGVGAFLFTPQAGDLACSDNVYYVYTRGSWVTLGSTGGGGDNTVVKFSVTDNFNRTNADPEGDDWAQQGSRDPKISSNTLMMGAGGTGSNMLAYFDNSATFANNQYSQMKINGFGEGGPAVRVQTGADESGYYMGVDNATSVGIYKIDTGASTILGAACSGTFTSSDTYKLTANGSTLTAYLNGTAISSCSRTDSTFTGGNPGVRLHAASGAADNWGGGDL